MEEIHRGSGNVFADLGFPDAEERQTKLKLAYALNQLIKLEGVSQAELGGRLGLPQPKVSALVNYKLHGFSVERLMGLFVVMGRDIKIVVRKKPKSRRAAKITVDAHTF